MGELAELVVLGLVVSLLLSVRARARVAGLQVAAGVAATVGVGALVVDRGFLGALLAAAAGAVTVAVFGLAMPARSTAARGRAGTSGPT